MTNGEAVVRKLYKSAKHGSLAAAKLLAGMLGEVAKPDGAALPTPAGNLDGDFHG